MHIILGHLGASDTLNQSFVCYLIKYTLALAGIRSLTSSGNLSISFIQKNTFLHRSTILFVAVGRGVIPIVPRLQVSSSLDVSIARTATSTMSKLTSKHRPTFPTSLSRHILAVTVPVKGLWEHFHTPLLVVRALCFPLCRA